MRTCELLRINLPGLISFIGHLIVNRSIINRFTAWQIQTVLYMVPCHMQQSLIQKKLIVMNRCFVPLRSKENCSIGTRWIIWPVPRDAQRDMHLAEIPREHASWLSSLL